VTGARPHWPVCRLGGLALAAAVVGGCSSTGAGANPAPPDTQTVTVLAAASLTEPLTELARAYEKAHPGVTIRTSFGSSTTLAQQVAQGAPADLVAFAGTTAVAQLPEKDRDPALSRVIARNTLEVATPPANPGRVNSLRDLARNDVDVVLCVPTAPCGKAADALLSASGIVPHVVSREVDVKATLAKVRLGEVDAAVVYHSDVVSAGAAVHGVAVTDTYQQVLTYPLIQLSDSSAARGFANYTAGAEGLAALARHGFLSP
jgi:molybdate transport system substrate-binding protein